MSTFHTEFLRFCFITHLTLDFFAWRVILGYVHACKDLVYEDIVGQLLESSRGYLEQLATERTSHLVSGSLVLSVLLETLEAERVDARQTLGRLERILAYGALQDIHGGAFVLLTRHILFSQSLSVVV